MIEREVLRSPAIGSQYDELLKLNFPSEHEDLDKLKKRFGFGTSKHVRRIRDPYAFHYLSHQWDLSHWEKVPPESVAMYVSQMRVNSFHEFSYQTVTGAMLAEADADMQTVFEAISDEVLEVSRRLLNVVHAIMRIAAEPLVTEGKFEVHKEPRVAASDPHRIRVPSFVNDRVRWRRR